MPHTSLTDLRHNDTVEVAIETRLLGEHIVGRRGEEDAHGPRQRRMGAVGEREVVFTQEGGEGGGLAREELQSHGSS